MQEKGEGRREGRTKGGNENVGKEKREGKMRRE